MSKVRQRFGSVDTVGGETDVVVSENSLVLSGPVHVSKRNFRYFGVGEDSRKKRKSKVADGVSSKVPCHPKSVRVKLLELGHYVTPDGSLSDVRFDRYFLELRSSLYRVLLSGGSVDDVTDILGRYSEYKGVIIPLNEDSECSPVTIDMMFYDGIVSIQSLRHVDNGTGFWPEKRVFESQDWTKSIVLDDTFIRNLRCLRPDIDVKQAGVMRDSLRESGYRYIPNSEAASFGFGERCIVLERDVSDDMYRAARSIALCEARIRDTGILNYIISLDSEYECSVVEGMTSEVNNVLSYQFVVSSSHGNCRAFIVLVNERAMFAACVDFAAEINGERGRCYSNALLLAHYTGAEWSVMCDREAISPHLTDIRQSPVSIGTGFMGQRTKLVTSGKVKKSYVRKFRIMLRDTKLVSPNGASLKSWGDVLSLTKLELADGDIERMGSVLRDKPVLFCEYGLRDAEVCLLAYASFMSWGQEMQLKYPGFRNGYTLGGTSVNALQSCLMGLMKSDALDDKVDDVDGIPGDCGKGLRRSRKGKGSRSSWEDILYRREVARCKREREALRDVKSSVDALFGYEKRVITCSKTLRRWNKRLMMPHLSHAHAFVSSCYHGGFNQAARVGHIKAPEGYRIYDVDIIGAYPSAMSLIPCVDFSRPTFPLMSVEDVLDCVHRGIPSMVFVKFRFPDGCMHPCLPTHHDGSLHYVLSGESYCTGEEIEIAVKMGCEFTSITGHGFHRLDDDVLGGYLFRPYLRDMMMERHRYPSKTLFNLLFKEMANSGYGKLAQGLKERHVSRFDTIDGMVCSDDLGPSAITNCVFAAMTTGIIRAVLHEMNACFRDNGIEVITSTTDGSMVCAPEGTDFNRLFEQGVGFKRLLSGRRALGIPNADKILEVKCSGASCYSWRTRANSILDDDGIAIHNAQGGIRFNGITDEAGIGFALRSLSDEPRVVKKLRRTLASPKSISHGKSIDLVSQYTDVNVHLDYDYKRRLLEDGHTVPWETIKDAVSVRQRVRDIHSLGERASFQRLHIMGSKTIVRDGNIDECIKVALSRVCAQGLNGWSYHDDVRDIHGLFGLIEASDDKAVMKERRRVLNLRAKNRERNIPTIKPAQYVTDYVRDIAQTIASGDDVEMLISGFYAACGSLEHFCSWKSLFEAKYDVVLPPFKTSCTRVITHSVGPAPYPCCHISVGDILSSEYRDNKLTRIILLSPDDKPPKARYTRQGKMKDVAASVLGKQKQDNANATQAVLEEYKAHDAQVSEQKKREREQRKRVQRESMRLSFIRAKRHYKRSLDNINRFYGSRRRVLGEHTDNMENVEENVMTVSTVCRHCQETQVPVTTKPSDTYATASSMGTKHSKNPCNILLMRPQNTGVSSSHRKYTDTVDTLMLSPHAITETRCRDASYHGLVFHQDVQRFPCFLAQDGPFIKTLNDNRYSRLVSEEFVFKENVARLDSPYHN